MTTLTRLVRTSGIEEVDQMKTLISNLRKAFVPGEVIAFSDIQQLTALWNLWIAHNHTVSDLNASPGGVETTKYVSSPIFYGNTVLPVSAGNSGVISHVPVQAIITSMISGLAHSHGWGDDR